MNYAAPSIKAWYDMSSYLDLVSLSDNKRRDHVCPSLIEMLVREMVESKLELLIANKKKARFIDW